MTTELEKKVLNYLRLTEELAQQTGHTQVGLLLLGKRERSVLHCH